MSIAASCCRLLESANIGRRRAPPEMYGTRRHVDEICARTKTTMAPAKAGGGERGVGGVEVAAGRRVVRGRKGGRLPCVA
jgi:hypothetical protein